MNTITQKERQRLVSIARQAIALDDAGEIIGGFEPAWRAFQAEHGISEARARAYVSKAARLIRGERVRAMGRPATLTLPASYTVYLEPRQVQTASEIGNGNVSLGVRLALDTFAGKE